MLNMFIKWTVYNCNHISNNVTAQCSAHFLVNYTPNFKTQPSLPNPCTYSRDGLLSLSHATPSLWRYANPLSWRARWVQRHHMLAPKTNTRHVSLTSSSMPPTHPAATAVNPKPNPQQWLKHVADMLLALFKRQKYQCYVQGFTC